MTTLTDDELLAWLERNAHGFSKGEEYQLYKSYCAQAAARFRELLALQEWQPIETAPRDGTTVLLFRQIDPWRVLGFGNWVDVHGIDGWLSQGFSDPPGNLGLGGPTHWRPLPSPPKDG